MVNFFSTVVVPVFVALLLINYAIRYFFGYLMAWVYLSYLKNKADKPRPMEAFVDGPPSPPGSLHSRFKNYLSNLIYGYLRLSMLQTGKIPSHTLRNFLYRTVYQVQLAKNAVIYAGAEIRGSHQLSIGEGTIIGDQAILDARNGITIGKNVNFSTGVWIWTDQHDLNSPWFSSGDAGGPVMIGDRAWISCRAVILPGVTIGEGAVVAAGAVVTKDVEPFAIYGGIPAKKIGMRNPDLKYHFNGEHLKFL